MNNDTIDFPKGDYKGLIFDLDGTLVDSMPAHYEAWTIALAEHGAEGIFPEDTFYAMGGRPTKEIIKALNAENNLTLDPDAVSMSKRTAFLSSLSKIKIIEPVLEFVKMNYGKVPMAIATGGTRIVAQKTVDLLDLSQYFQTMVTADDVTYGKPDPEVFLKAAAAINIAPEDCIAFEDAVPGILSAQAAGMKVVTIPSPLNVK